jgi:hypothetical protein
MRQERRETAESMTEKEKAPGGGNRRGLSGSERRIAHKRNRPPV